MFIVYSSSRFFFFCFPFLEEVTNDNSQEVNSGNHGNRDNNNGQNDEETTMETEVDLDLDSTPLLSDSWVDKLN